MPEAAAEARIALRLPDEHATARLAEDIAAVLKPGDLLALSGGLGAGKTTFVRALIRALADEPAREVPSPTFPLRLDHALPRMTVVHADLYRLEGSEELEELGLDEVVGESALLVEWPELLPAGLSHERLDIRLDLDGEGRRAEMSGAGTWPARLRRSFAIRAFLDQSGRNEASRIPLAGDASYRAYEIIADPSPPSRGRAGQGGNIKGAAVSFPPPHPPPQGGRGAAILMNAPARIEGASIYAGRSYDAVAHRAMDIRAFVAIDLTLREAGIRAPEIFAADLDRGLLLHEDLGSEGLLDASAAPILFRYGAAIDLLVYMHGRIWPDSLPLPGGGTFNIPPYDREALLVEVSLFPDWFGAQSSEPAFPGDRRDAFLSAWSELLASIEQPNTTWTLRDFHSPNILWQEKSEGIARVGVIDFQDALIGHPAYDVASLAQDARVDLSAADEAQLKARYIAARRAADPAFDVRAFERAYAILALQRATKVLGIFTRLALAEGKPGYQQHRTRLKALIRRTLANSVLSPMRFWYEPYL